MTRLLRRTLDDEDAGRRSYTTRTSDGEVHEQLIVFPTPTPPLHSPLRAQPPSLLHAGPPQSPPANLRHHQSRTRPLLPPLVNMNKMGSKLQIQGDESVLLRVTHSNIKSFNTDVRFSLQTTVESVKEKLWKKSGTSVGSMCLELYDDSSSKISDLSDNIKSLGFYSPYDGYRLHIIDLDPSSVTSGGWLEDTSLVEKYTISDEAYEKLDGTFRKFKERFPHQNSSSGCVKITENHMEDLCANIKVGDRCQVEPGDKRGAVKYVGRAENLSPGFWVGVQYDEPLGKHDGMVKETRFFECPPLHGAMVRPDKMKVGDYPERDPFEEDEI